MNVLKEAENPLAIGLVMLGYKPVLPEGSFYYFGLVPAIDDESVRPTEIDLAELTKVEQSPSAPLNLEFADYTGFQVLVLPVNAKSFNTWYIKSNDKGNIGGDVGDIYNNLFPDPELWMIDGAYYKVYITSYFTRFTTITLL